MASIEVLLSVEHQWHFGDAPGKVVQGCFCTERSIGHIKQLMAVLEGVVDLSGMGFYPDW